MPDELQRRIIDSLRQRPEGVLFNELEDIPGFSGDTRLEFSNWNIVLWGKCSTDAVTAVQSLIVRRMVAVKPTQPFAYGKDAGDISLPVARVWNTYETPTWLPASLIRGPSFR